MLPNNSLLIETATQPWSLCGNGSRSTTVFMVTFCHGNAFHINGPLWGEWGATIKHPISNKNWTHHFGRLIYSMQWRVGRFRTSDTILQSAQGCGGLSYTSLRVSHTFAVFHFFILHYCKGQWGALKYLARIPRVSNHWQIYCLFNILFKLTKIKYQNTA